MLPAHKNLEKIPESYKRWFVAPEFPLCYPPDVHEQRKDVFIRNLAPSKSSPEPIAKQLRPAIEPGEPLKT
jgi:hypothetical protein